MIFNNKIHNNATVYDILIYRGIIMVRIHLSKILGEKRMTQKQLSDLTGIRPNTINEWYHEMAISLKLEHIDRICEVLNCPINELIEVIPNKIPKTGKSLIIEEHGNQKTKKRM